MTIVSVLELITRMTTTIMSRILLSIKIVCFKKVKGNKNTKNNKNIPLTELKGEKLCISLKS